MALKMILLLSSAILWTIVYVDSIRIGIKDKSYAIPLWALGLNFSWEALHSYFRIQAVGIDAQSVVNIIWMVLDIGILYTFFKYGRKHFSAQLSKNNFILWTILVFVACFVIEYMFIVEFDTLIGGSYSAFLQNLVMSVLFIDMLIKRKSSEGQSMLIAVCKFLGTLAPIVFFGIIGNKNFNGEPNKFILGIGVFVIIFDLLYIYLLAKKKKQEQLQ